MKEIVQELKTVKKYAIDEKNKHIEVFIESKDYMYKHQLYTALYRIDPQYVIKISYL